MHQQSPPASEPSKSSSPISDDAFADVEYTYPALPEGHVRILDLYPGAESDVLVLSLSVEPLGSAPYSAVSYCWGSSERPHRVACGSSTVEKGEHWMTVTPASRPSGYIRITDNLRSLLLAIRNEETYLRLWIDSICINQDDLSEKAAQVRQMDRVFGDAHATLVYLGDWGRDADAAWRCAGVLSRMKDWDTTEVQSAIHTIEDVGVEVDDGVMRSFGDMWPDFLAFLSRPWFSRVWIVQEVIQSRSLGLYCGRKSCAWELIVDACTAVQRHSIRAWDQQAARCTSVLDMERRRQGYLEFRRQLKENGAVDWGSLAQFRIDMNFSMLQIWTRAYGASDPRDKVYALLNIAIKEEQETWPEVDYTVSVPYLYCKLAEIWFQTQPSRPLDFLACVNGARASADIPSWVPDWRDMWESHPLGQINATGGGACGDRKCQAAFPALTDPIRLPLQFVARGAWLLTVMDTDCLKLPGNSWRNARHAQLINQFAEPYPTTSESFAEAFAKAANPQAPHYLGNIPDRTEKFWDFMEEAPRTLVESKSAGGSNTQRSKRYEQGDLYEKLPQSYEIEYPVSQEALIRGRRWFIANEGMMGLVPEHTLPGDQIVMLFGGRMLYVVRPMRVDEPGRRIYKFIGECSVYGLMDGEAAVDLPDEMIRDLVLE